MVNKPKTNNKEASRDIMLTPPYALEVLLPLLLANDVIWEPAYHKDSYLASFFESHNYKVVKSGLPDNDYFDYDPEFWDVQITNPPFSKKYEWIDRALGFSKPFALLVPYETTASQTFVNILQKHKIHPDRISVLHTGTRIDFKTHDYGWGKKVWDENKNKYVMRGGSAQMPTTWLTFDLMPEDEKVYPLLFNTYYAPIKKVKYTNDTEI